MPPSNHDRLRLAVGAFGLFGSGARKLAQGLADGFEPVREYLGGLPTAQREAIDAQVETLAQRAVEVVFCGEPSFPVRLLDDPRVPPVLFTWGNTTLLGQPSIGMCGSRHVSDRGLEAARACGNEVAEHGLTIVSGYAKGVDTETHLAALETGGHTVIVLAEGILHFRTKRVFAQVGLDEARVLVVSQFPPAQRWNVGGAMTRNGIISGLGRALVVIEAGETGGTLNAGLQALSLNRPVLALEFRGGATPPGNQILIDKGAIPIRSRQQLGRVVQAIEETPGHSPDVEQLSML